MRDLIELIHRLPWAKLQSSPMWRTLLPENTKMAHLFSLVQANDRLTDEEAARALYSNTSALNRLWSLKSKTKNRLLGAIFLLDPSDMRLSDRQQAYYECQRRWATALALSARRVSTVAVEQLEQMLRYAEHFEFTELAMSAAFHLRHHYGAIAVHSDKYQHYRTLYRQYQALWAVENLAEELYTDILHTMANTRAAHQAIGQLAQKHFERIEPHLRRYHSFRLHLNGRLLQMLIYTSRNDYRTAAALCEEAIAFFQNKPYRSLLPQQIFYYQLVVCCLHLRDFARGQHLIRQHADLYVRGSHNWFKIQELYFLLALHTQHYDDAFDTCAAVMAESEWHQQPPSIQETWKIFRAYTEFLARIRRADRPPSPHFRMGKLLNETPIFSKDRRGMNIPILVVQLLYDLWQKRYDAAIDRAEALSKYTDRYIRRNENFRSNCFMKMLLQLPKVAFHREAAVRATQRYRTLLSSVPIELANQPHEIEIIPYEDLWEMVLTLLPQERVRG